MRQRSHQRGTWVGVGWVMAGEDGAPARATAGLGGAGDHAICDLTSRIGLWVVRCTSVDPVGARISRTA